MDLQTWIAYFVASWAIALSPGSGAVLSMSHGLAYGVRQTSATIAGLQLGLAVILLVAGVGVGAVDEAGAGTEALGAGVAEDFQGADAHAQVALDRIEFGHGNLHFLGHRRHQRAQLQHRRVQAVEQFEVFIVSDRLAIDDPAIDRGTIAQRAGQVVDAINAKSTDTGVFARPVYTAGAVTGYEVFSDRAIVAADFGNFAAGTTGAGVNTAAAADSFVEDINVTSFGDSQLALRVIDNAINAVNSSRADLGALQSRFENAVANIQITGENISAARGRIIDADFAKETSNLSRAQILQQAGTAMVAQANQAQQGVLSLLR